MVGPLPCHMAPQPPQPSVAMHADVVMQRASTWYGGGTGIFLIGLNQRAHHSPPLMAPAHISSSSAMHGMARLQHCAGATPLAVATVAGEGGWFCQKVSPDAPLWVLQSSVQRSWPCGGGDGTNLRTSAIT